MGFATLHQITLSDLRAMTEGTLEDTITDMDFLETLAVHQCLLVPPWVVQAARSGGIRKVARLVYTCDGDVDKPRVLLAVARELRRLKSMRLFGRMGLE